MHSPLIPLESIQIASPCRADWNAMQKVHGHNCIRFCPSCGKNVYDLSGMTREQGMNLIEAKEGNVCLRLHRRTDGTVITSDCPVGKSSRIKRNTLSQMLVAVVAFGTGTLAVGSVWFNRLSHKTNAPTPKTAQAKLVSAPPTNALRPEATPFPTPSPIRPQQQERDFSEGALVTNGAPESSRLPAPEDAPITMGAPCPSPEPTPTSEALITLPNPATTP